MSSIFNFDIKVTPDKNQIIRFFNKIKESDFNIYFFDAKDLTNKEIEKYEEPNILSDFLNEGREIIFHIKSKDKHLFEASYIVHKNLTYVGIERYFLYDGYNKHYKTFFKEFLKLYQGLKAECEYKEDMNVLVSGELNSNFLEKVEKEINRYKGRER